MGKGADVDLDISGNKTNRNISVGTDNINN